MKKLIMARRSSQIFFLLLFIYILWSTTYPLKGLLPPETFFRTNPLIMVFTSISERLILPGMIFALVMIVLTLVFGRFYCGWICPLGTIIDGTAKLHRKKIRPDAGANSRIRKIKFFILGIIAVFSLIGTQVAWILDPMVIVGRFVSLNLIPTATLALNRSFIFLIQNLNMDGAVYDLYRTLKGSILGVQVHYFSSSPVIFIFFILVISSALVVPRFWCRAICPLGALYALAAKFALLRRVVEKCIGCHACVRICRTGAIIDGANYSKGECILCMDCIYHCAARSTKFTWPVFGKGAGSGSGNEIAEDAGAEGRKGLSRREFLFLFLSSVFAFGFKWRKGAKKEAGNVIRPPAALEEGDFLDRCIRCGNCMKVCPTNVLQPTVLQAGLEGIWTPHLVNEIGWCEYKCTLCGQVCPTGAITRITTEKKMTTKLGLAEIDKTKCIAWANSQECLVCEEHCPVASKAIKIDKISYRGKTIGRPVVDEKLCVGCGICQNKCPTRPDRAIRVVPQNAGRVPRS